MKTPCKIVASIAVVISSLPLATQAADGSWNVDGNGTWSTAGNWTPGIPGATSGTASTDTATFGLTLTANRTVTVDSNRNIKNITFSNTSGFKYTLSGGSLLLSDGGLIQSAAGNGNHTDTISTPIQIQGDGGSATITAGASSATSLLTIGAVTGVSTGSNVTTLTLNGDNTGANIISGIIGNGSGGGKLALVKSGNGEWQLSGVNTFTGGITIKSGILNAQTSTSALGAGTVTLGDSSGSSAATLKQGSFITTNTINVASGSSGLLTITNAGNATPTYNGAITLNNNLSIVAGGTGTGAALLTLGGGIAGTGNLNIAHTSASNTAAAIIQTNDINMTGSITNSSTGTVKTIINSVIGTNVTGLTQNGNSKLYLNAANTYSGDTVLTSGTMYLQSAGAQSLSGNTTTASGQISGLTSTAGLVVGQAVSGTGIAAGAIIVNIDSPTAVTVNLKGTANGTATASFSALTGGSIANSALDTTGSGTLTLTGITTPTFGGLKNSGAARDLASVFTAITGGYSGVTSLTLNPGSGKTYSYSGNITNGAAGMSLTKSGLGSQTLSGTNSYTGTTTVSAGTLIVSGGGLTATSGITVSGGALELGAANVIGDTATITLSGGTLSAQSFADTLGILTLSGNSSISLAGGTLAFSDSSAATWGSFTLDITGFVSGSSLRFGITNLGLSSAQLLKFTASGFDSFGLNSSGYLTAVAVPEASTWALLAGSLTALVIFRRRRRV